MGRLRRDGFWLHRTRRPGRTPVVLFVGRLYAAPDGGCRVEVDAWPSPGLALLVLPALLFGIPFLVAVVPDLGAPDAAARVTAGLGLAMFSAGLVALLAWIGVRVREDLDAVVTLLSAALRAPIARG